VRVFVSLRKKRVSTKQEEILQSSSASSSYTGRILDGKPSTVGYMPYDVGHQAARC